MFSFNKLVHILLYSFFHTGCSEMQRRVAPRSTIQCQVASYRATWHRMWMHSHQMHYHMQCIACQCPAPLCGGMCRHTAMQHNASVVNATSINLPKFYVHIDCISENHTTLIDAQLTSHTCIQICHFYHTLAPEIPGLSYHMALFA